MSYYVVKPPHRGRFTPTLLVAGAVALLVLLGLSLFAGWAAARPVWVTVDGLPRLIEPGATVGALDERGVLAAPGRLLSVEGSVLATAGGDPPTVVRNGEPARPGQRLYAGDVVTSTPGRDRRESVVVTEVPLPYKTRYQGRGPMVEMKTLGAPGAKRLTLGAISGIEVTSTVVREPSDLVIRRYRPSGKVVALTFDDGPWPRYTAKVLDVLSDEEVPATFFMLGRLVDRYPKLARRVAKEGHDVASHSFSHRRFNALSEGQIGWEIRRGREVLREATGRDTRLLRPPYGVMDGQAWAEVRARNARVVLWDVDSRDWTKPGAKRIQRTVLRNVEPGSVVLFHDGGGNRAQTVRALRGIIRKLKARGYQFVTVSELYEMKADR